MNHKYRSHLIAAGTAWSSAFPSAAAAATWMKASRLLRAELKHSF